MGKRESELLQATILIRKLAAKGRKMCPKMKQKETRVDQAILSWTCRRQHGLMFGLAQKQTDA